ncbi:hypothetical protein LTR41_009577 [Exophiala xenobiotica]|nr:hypothetical protein LTR41_009577 [Exophiala xenobiotica]
MAPVSQAYWTDECVNSTVTSAYVHSQLRPDEQELLQRPLYFGVGLTDDTYLDWILTRAKRFFLILVAAGVPDQIFGIVDDSYDDDDLPIAEHAVPDLRLSYEPNRSLDRRFYKTQFRFLSRVVGEAEHIRYADEETVPVIIASLKTVVGYLGQEGTDRVRLPGKTSEVYLRRRITFDQKTTEADLLNEIATSRRLRHEHIISVFASYTHQGSCNVLSLPAPEWNLKSFLSDTPKSFSNLSKTDRRHLFINWPHCLATAVAWLHSKGQHHGAIRPSNIHITESFHICLGSLEGDGILCDNVRSEDIEAYQYGPPERYKRAITVRSTGSAAISLPSGGRTGRRIGRKDNETSSNGRNSVRTSGSVAPTYTFQPTSRGDYARLRLSATTKPDSRPTVRGRSMRVRRTPSDNNSISTQDTTRPERMAATPKRAPSIQSSTSSNSNKLASIFDGPMFVAAPEARSAVVQTWQSMEDDMFASDMFSLGAVMVDIVTVLCKRTYSAFSRHRASKNRMAGRGGGLADASFHANLGQVFTWAQSLQNDAEKKAKKDESKAYHAVGPIVQLALQCLARDPAARLASETLEEKLFEHIRRSASISHLHCTGRVLEGGDERSSSVPMSQNLPASERRSDSRSTERLRQASSNLRTLATERHQQQEGPTSQEIPPRNPRRLQPPFIHIPKSTATTPVTTSASSLASFNFDGLSDTVVADSPRSREQSLRRESRRRNESRPPHDDRWSAEHDGPKKSPYTWHKNDSQVDPRLSFGGSVDTGAFTYLNYSTSASSDEGTKYFSLRSPSGPPPQAPPNRSLPPVPPIPPESTPVKIARRPKAVREDVDKRKAPPGLKTWSFTLDEVDQQIAGIDAFEDNHSNSACASRGPFTVFPTVEKPEAGPRTRRSGASDVDFDCIGSSAQPLETNAGPTPLSAIHPLTIPALQPSTSSLSGECPSSWFELNPELFQDPVIHQLMDNYVGVCAKVLPPLPHPKNAYATIYVPKAMAGASNVLFGLNCAESEVPSSNIAIFYAVLATSAFHLRSTNAESGLRFDVLARGFRAKAFESLQKALQEPLENIGDEALLDLSTQSTAHLEAIMSAMLTLVTMDIMEGSMSEYWIHLEGMDRLSTQLQREEHASPKIARLTTISTFLSTLASTTSLELTPMPWTGEHYDTLEFHFSTTGTGYGLEYAYGITPTLANIMQQILTLSRHISYYTARSDPFPPTLISACRKLSDTLSSWSMDSEAIAELFLSSGTDFAHQLGRNHILAFAHALRVYYHIRILPCRSSEMREHIDRVARHLIEIEEIKSRAGYDHNISATITWPGFIASCEAERGHCREVWYRWWHGMLQYGIGNIAELWKVVQQAWAIRDNEGLKETPAWVPVLRRSCQRILVV